MRHDCMGVNVSVMELSRSYQWVGDGEEGIPD